MNVHPEAHNQRADERADETDERDALNFILASALIPRLLRRKASSARLRVLMGALAHREARA
jgi:hypothetical protein